MSSRPRGAQRIGSHHHACRCRQLRHSRSHAMSYSDDINTQIPEGPAVKVGVCMDFPIIDVHRPFLDSIRMAFDEAYAGGVLDRPCRLIVNEAEGLPRGDAAAVVRAWQELVDKGCVAV